MPYLLNTVEALLLGHTVRYLAGNVAGICTVLLTGLFSLVFSKQPGLSLLLAVGVWAGVRSTGESGLAVLNTVPLLTLGVLVILRASTVPAVPLCLADAIALISLAYRGWSKKRLLD